MIVSVKRFAVSFEPELAEEVRSVSGGNVSAWLADAARQKLRQAALTDAVRRFEEDLGPITDAELDAVRSEWPV